MSMTLWPQSAGGLNERPKGPKPPAKPKPQRVDAVSNKLTSGERVQNRCPGCGAPPSQTLHCQHCGAWNG